MKYVLVYEPSDDSVRLSQLIFLLNLVDYYCLEARDSNQGLNWVCMIQQHRIKCDLVLINSLENKGVEQLFLKEIACLDIPILFLQHGITVPEPLQNKAIVCESEDLLAYLQGPFKK